MNHRQLKADHITVVGGGITGLATAYLAAKAGASVTVVEAGKQFGGLLNTFEIGGNRLEFYYHHFFTHDAELNWLIRELGIQDKLQFHPTTMGVFRKGNIYDFNSPRDLLTFNPIGLIDKLRFGLTSLYLGKVAQWEQYEGISCLEWLYQYAGKGTTEALWKPLLDIKFGPYAGEVPLAWMIGRLRQRMNSRQRGDERLGYLSGSLDTLLQALLSQLEAMGVELITEAPVSALHIHQNQLTGIETAKGTFKGGRYVFTIPTIYLADMLQQGAPNLADTLNQVEYFGAVCTILETDRKLSDIYWLNVADPGFPFGGVIEHTNFIPPTQFNGKHITYLSRYFAHSEPIARMDKAEIISLMLPPLAKIYPDFKEAWIHNIHVFKTHTAATVCELNFSQKVPSCETELDNCYLASMSHIYPDERSTNNSIRVAAEACKVLGLEVTVPTGSSLSGKIGF